LNRRWKKRRLFTVVHLPLVPQKHHGKAKNHPQNGAPNIVHEGFFSEEGVEIKRLKSRGSPSRGRS
jgi:hypothetical protein